MASIEAMRALAASKARLDAAQRKAWQAYDAKREGAVDMLLALLENNNAATRLAAVQALAAFVGEPGVLEKIRAHGNDPNESIIVKGAVQDVLDDLRNKGADTGK